VIGEKWQPGRAFKFYTDEKWKANEYRMVNWHEKPKLDMRFSNLQRLPRLHGLPRPTFVTYIVSASERALAYSLSL
jgi:hypothetical protein